MAFSIQYKKLFEVEILHEYFLEKEGKSSFFDLGRGSEERFERLEHYDLRNYVRIEPTKRCAEQLRNYHLIFKASRTGFFVGAEVDEVYTLDGSKGYRPTFGFDENVHLDFRINVADERFTRFSNSALYRNLKAKYFFAIPTLEQDVEVGDPLLLTLPTAEYLKNRQYEPGDRVFLMDGIEKMTYQARIRTKSSPISAPDAWIKLEKDYGFVSEDDAQIIPRYSSYRFNSKEPILEARFRLTDQSGTEIWQSGFEDGEAGRTQFALFLSDRELVEAVVEERVKTGHYTLDVEGMTNGDSNPFIHKRQVMLNDVLFNGGDNLISQKATALLGMLRISLNSQIPAYQVLDDQGYLKTSDGALQHPVYEIRFQSLQSKWVYKGRKIQELDINEASSSVVKVVMGGKQVLVTEHMLSTIQSGRKIKLVFNNEEAYYLPNPNGMGLFSGEDGQKYSEVLINSI